MPAAHKRSAEDTRGAASPPKRRCRPHPLGILPSGNALLAPMFSHNAHSALGPHFCRLSDDILIHITSCISSISALLALSGTCQYWYAVSGRDDLWRERVTTRFGGEFDWMGTWRATYLHQSCPSYLPPPHRIRLRGVYSDALHRPHQCATIDLERLRTAPSNVDCVSADDLSLETFRDRYEIPSVPVVISRAIDHWPAMKTYASLEYLSTHYGDKMFRAENVTISLARFLCYARDNNDEAPLYLFDMTFPTTSPQMTRDYDTPVYFRENLFEVLTDAEGRPDWRWVIIGGAGSGSTWHKDPNGTGAWNATIVGEKRWLIFPAHTPPPGVFTSQDESEVTSPVSVAEWLLSFREQLPPLNTKSAPYWVCTTRPGDVIFVPPGSWHCVLNLDTLTVAVTQNFCSRENLANVVGFVRDRPEQVSGCRGMEAGLWQRWQAKLIAAGYGDLLAEAELAADARLAPKATASLWDKIKEPLAANEETVDSGAFSFGFDDQGDE